jgi:hypothetical protein
VLVSDCELCIAEQSNSDLKDGPLRFLKGSTSYGLQPEVSTMGWTVRTSYPFRSLASLAEPGGGFSLHASLHARSLQKPGVLPLASSGCYRHTGMQRYSTP